MSKQIVQIPFNSIKKIQIYINDKKQTLSQIRDETGADYAMNGGLFDMAKWKANCNVKSNGKVYVEDGYSYWGYSWNTGADISMKIVPDKVSQNYICCVDLIRNSIKTNNLIYNAALSGKRGRTAMGIIKDKLCLYVSSDGSSDAQSPEGLRDELFLLGMESAIMLDGGGSSQCDFKGAKIGSSRIVQNLILIYLNTIDKENKPISNEKKVVCIDPGHGPDTVNGSPDGTYKEKDFTWDMYQRIKPMLEKQGVTVVGTRLENEKPELTTRANISNKAGADLFISLHSNAEGGSGWGAARGLIVYTSASGATSGRNIAAGKILSEMKTSGVLIRGTGLAHDISLTVLAKTNAPAVLMEYGFHTNKEDTALLLSPAYRDSLATATAKGICSYLGISWEQSPPPAPAPQPTPGTDVSDWAKAAWTKATASGIFDGTNPKGILTREQAAVLFDRLGFLK